VSDFDVNPAPALEEPVEPQAPVGPHAPVEQLAAVSPEATEAVDQSELDLGVISSGNVVVDATLEPLEGLPGLPVGDHAGVFEGVLADLSATMADGPDDADDADSGTGIGRTSVPGAAPDQL
jgi:hypothetical protein